MKLIIAIDEIDYAGAALRVLPLLEKALDQDSAAGMTAAAVSRLPAELVRSLFDAVPDGEKNAIAAAFAEEYSDKILDAANRMSRENRIGVTLEDLRVSRDLQIEAEAGGIDYPCVVSRFLTVIKEKLLGLGGPVMLMRPLIMGASAEQICGLMDRFLGSRKEEFLAALVNQNRNALTAMAEDMAGKEGVRLKIRNLEAKA